MKLDPINPKASLETANLYYFLQSISGKYILTGLHNYTNTGSKYTDKLEKLTGKRAVVWGSDFNWCFKGNNPEEYQHAAPLNISDPEENAYVLDVDMDEVRQQMVSEAIEQHSNGHIITLMWHCCFPAEGECCEGSSVWTWNHRPSAATWKELITEGTPLNDAWKKGVDKVAFYLKQLQDACIPVLWRPYHEMNGVWFWWCNQSGDDGFKKLWIMLYNYLTHHHNLNNLIWVWNANAPRHTPGDEAYSYNEFYPGNEFVDVLAADVYHKDYKQSHHDDLVTLGGGKPIALGEVGDVPPIEILDTQKNWTWFMPWGKFAFDNSKPEDIIAFFNVSNVLSLGDIMREQDGRYLLRNSQS